MMLPSTIIIKPKYLVSIQIGKMSTKMTKKTNKILVRNISFDSNFIGVFWATVMCISLNGLPELTH